MWTGELPASPLHDINARLRHVMRAEFRSDVESFVSIKALRAVTVAGRAELAPQPRVR